MSDQLKTLPKATLTGSHRFTCSQALQDGPELLSLQDGQKTNQCGPDHVRVNLSARQAKAQGLLTSGTYGQHSTGLSANADLSLYLGSRLQARLENHGSTLYNMTWRQKSTPSGCPFWQHVVSVRRTSESDCTGWATPVAKPAGGTPEAFIARKEKARDRGSEDGGSADGSGDAGNTSGVANTNSKGESGRGIQGYRKSDSQGDGTALERSPGLCKDGGMANANDNDGPQGRGERGHIAAECATWESSLAYCRDGKARPFKPGVLPLADGLPGRLELINGYGNAIVPQCGAAFIEACMSA